MFTGREQKAYLKLSGRFSSTEHLDLSEETNVSDETELQEIKLRERKEREEALELFTQAHYLFRKFDTKSKHGTQIQSKK